MLLSELPNTTERKRGKGGREKMKKRQIVFFKPWGRRLAATTFQAFHHAVLVGFQEESCLKY